jgi:hypothetical protein
MIYTVVVIVCYWLTYDTRRASKPTPSSSYLVFFFEVTEMTNSCDSSRMHTDYWNIYSVAPCPLKAIVLCMADSGHTTLFVTNELSD